MKKRLALFKTDYGMIMTSESIMEFVPGCKRISEYVDVDFPDIIEPALDHSEYNYE